MLNKIFASIGLLLLPVISIAGITELPSIAKTSAIWPSPEIQVCWEDDSSVFARERAWVQDAVINSWQKYGNIKFIYWGNCASVDSSKQVIRIYTADINPHVIALGRELDNKPRGMALNFVFRKWSPDCQNNVERCIRVIAIHEFGHALSLGHEQNREDSPDWCKAKEQGEAGDWPITAFDMQSVMNYCNPSWSGNGRLSESDIEGIRRLYPRLVRTTIDTSRWYRLITQKSARCLHVQNNNANRRNLLSQWSCDTSGDEFAFKFEPISGGLFRIKSAYGQCYHVQDGPNKERRKS